MLSISPRRRVELTRRSARSFRGCDADYSTRIPSTRLRRSERRAALGPTDRFFRCPLSCLSGRELPVSSRPRGRIGARLHGKGAQRRLAKLTGLKSQSLNCSKIRRARRYEPTPADTEDRVHLQPLWRANRANPARWTEAALAEGGGERFQSRHAAAGSRRKKLEMHQSQLKSAHDVARCGDPRQERHA